MGKRGDEAKMTTADVYKLADSLLQSHGRDAVLVASMRAGERLSCGDLEGYRTWKRLVMLVDGMTDPEPATETNWH